MKTVTVIFAGIFVMFISCQSPKESPILIENFFSIEWKFDSLACIGNRRNLAGKLDSGFSKIQGQNELKLINLLGKPNLKKETKNGFTYCYFIGPGLQCKDSLWRTKQYSDCEQINYFIDREQRNVIGSTGVIYP